jgi:hypothetical protein
MVTNAFAWLIQLCSHCQEAEEDINLLADPRHNEETIDIDITHLPEYSNPHCKNTSETLLGDDLRCDPPKYTDIREFQCDP